MSSGSSCGRRLSTLTGNCSTLAVSSLGGAAGRGFVAILDYSLSREPNRKSDPGKPLPLMDAECLTEVLAVKHSSLVEEFQAAWLQPASSVFSFGFDSMKN